MEYNAVLIESEGLVKTLASGKGAGPAPTSVSLMADLLDIAEGRARIPGADHPFLGKPLDLGGREGAQSRFYLRLSVPDRPGSLAQVAGLFARHDISIASVLQPEVSGSVVPLILTTHATTRHRLDLVLASLTAEGWGRSVVLRIQES
jgi:homoserine dehydrogenase